MKIDEIYNQLETYPTFMGADREISIINSLIKLSNKEIVNNLNIFIKIIERLDESHLNDGYFAVEDKNKKIFYDFSEWILNISKSSLIINYKEDLEAFSETFLLDPKKIYPGYGA